MRLPQRAGPLRLALKTMHNHEDWCVRSSRRDLLCLPFVRSLLLWIFLDTLAIMLLVRWVTGEENEGWFKPAAIAVLTWFAMFPVYVVDSIIASGPIVLVTTYSSVAVLLFLGSWLMMDIAPRKALAICTLFTIYKLALTITVAAAFAYIPEWIERNFFSDIFERTQ